RPSLPKPSAPESNPARRVLLKRASMRAWIAWMAGVRMVMSGADCACADPMPTSISGSKSNDGPRMAMPPSSPVSGAGAASSPITFSTNWRAASRASAAGKDTLMVTQAVSATAARGVAIQRFMRVSCCRVSLYDRCDLAPAGGHQALEQGRPVDQAVVADHGQARQAGALDDGESRSAIGGPAGRRLQAAHLADLVGQAAGNADVAIAEVVEQADQAALQAAGERRIADTGNVLYGALADALLDIVAARGGAIGVQLGFKGGRGPVDQAQVGDAAVELAGDAAETEHAGELLQVDVVEGEVGGDRGSDAER